MCSNHPSSEQDQQQGCGLSRRQALAGGAGLAAGSSLLLSACSSQEQDSTALTEETGRPTQPTEMAASSDVPVGGVIRATADGVSVMITQPQENEFHAFSSVCTHQGCQLNAVKDKTLACPCHASQFDLSTGAVLGGPAETPLPEFTVEVKEGKIWVS